VDLATRSRQISFCMESIKPLNLRGHVDSMAHEVEVIKQANIYLFFIQSILYVIITGPLFLL
jgi:hypothetical protein